MFLSVDLNKEVCVYPDGGAVNVLYQWRKGDIIELIRRIDPYHLNGVVSFDVISVVRIERYKFFDQNVVMHVDGKKYTRADFVTYRVTYSTFLGNIIAGGNIDIDNMDVLMRDMILNRLVD